MSGHHDNSIKSILSQWSSLNQNRSSDLDTTSFNKPSMGQQRLYFLNQLYPVNPVYNLAEVWSFNGEFNKDLFLKALNIIGESQQILRTNFINEQGQLVCHIQEKFKFLHQYVNLNEFKGEELEIKFQTIARTKSRTIFNLSSGPLLDITICELNTLSFRVILTLHHIIADKWSMRILRSQLSKLYIQLLEKKRTKLDPLTQQFSDYAFQESKRKVDERILNYWKEKLENLPESLVLPYDKQVPKNKTLAGEYILKQLPRKLFRKIKQFCQSQQITSFSFFLSVFKLLLHRYSQNDDILVGTPLSTRSKLEHERLIGFFNDSIVLRSVIDAKETFFDFISKTNQTVLEAFKHKEIGFETIINEINPNRSINLNPLFQVMFLYNRNLDNLQFANNITIKVDNYDIGVSKFELTLYVEETKDNFNLTIEYATDLFSTEFIQRIHNHITELITHALSQPETPVSKLRLIGPKDNEQLIKISSGPEVEIPENETILSNIFKSSYQNEVAIVDEKLRLTYEELNLKSNQIANALLEYSLAPEEIIGVYLNQSANFVVAMIGILKSGLTYLPLDISYPVDRTNGYIKKAQVQYTISSIEVERNQIIGTKFIDIELINAPLGFIPSEIEKGKNAYVIFTSGSSGVPKGVRISRANLLNSIKARFYYYQEHPTAFLLMSSFSFDSSVAGIYWTLMNGGKLIIPNKQTFQDTEALSDLILKESVSHTLLIPSLYSVFLEYIPIDVLENFCVIILAGESLPSHLANKHNELLSNVKLFNEYGPTEATVWVSAYKIESGQQPNSIPIGKPISNTSLFILDKNGNFTPKGMPGELYIGGASLTSGYIGSSSEDQSKFIIKSVHPNMDFRLYRTGDWAQLDPNDDLIFLGRKDDQIKIRGHRIELNEIDITIRSYNEGIDPRTMFFKDQNKLISFIKSPESVNAEELIKYLSQKLPKHYCPDKIILLDHFPLQPNGKVDDASLRQLSLDQSQLSQNDINLFPIQNKLLDIWKEVLNKPQLKITDNFFDAGGDSIQIIRIISGAKKLGVSLTPKDIYNHQNIQSITDQYQLEEFEVSSPLTWDSIPVSPMQEWFFSTHKNDPSYWLQGYSFVLSRPIILSEIQMAIKVLVEQHEGFQSCFKKKYNRWFQIRKSYALEEYLITTNQDHLKDLRIDHENGPLVRFILFCDNNSVLRGKIVAHHLIVDAISWDIIFKEFEDYLKPDFTSTAIKRSGIVTWSQELMQLSSTDVFDDSIPFWNEVIQYKSVYFSKYSLPCLEKNAVTLKCQLHKQATLSLKLHTRRVLSLKVDEAVIAAFLQVFYRNSKENNLTIMLEGHGRNHEILNADLTDTIGWHTTYYPLHFTLSNPASIIQSAIDVKEKMRSVPNSGLGFGVLKYLTKKLDGQQRVDVVINHLGNRIQSSSKVFKEVNFLEEDMRSPKSERDNLIEINTWIQNDELHIAYTFDSLQLEAPLMQIFLDELVDQLELVGSTLQEEGSLKTPSDFKYILNSNELSILINAFAMEGLEIVDILDLTAMQSALLFQNLQLADIDIGLIVVQANLAGPFNKSAFQKSWEILINHFEVLRSCFIWENVIRPVQVIFDTVQNSINYLDYSNYSKEDFDHKIEALIQSKSSKNLKLNQTPIFQIDCIRKSDVHHKIILTCHHIYLDGWSTGILLKAFEKVYNWCISNANSKLTPLPTLSTWKAQFDLNCDKEETKSFWHKYLRNIKPTLLKRDSFMKSLKFDTQTFQLSELRSSEILDTTQNSRITLNTLFLGIWSWLLKEYTLSEEITVGTTVSGRSLPLNQMTDLVGMFSNLLPLKINLNKEIDFNAIQNTFNEILEFDFAHIEDVLENQSQVRGNLFDTLLITENFPYSEDKTQVAYISEFKSQASSTFPLSIIVFPGNEIGISVRYNSNVFTKLEIKDILADLNHVLNMIIVENGKAIIDFKPKFGVKNNDIDQEFNLPEIEIMQSQQMAFDDKVLAIWKQVLNNDGIGKEDHFFSIGGTSLQAVSIFNKIFTDLGINASPILMLKNSTVLRLAAALTSDSVKESWNCVYPLKEGTQNEQALFCFHAGDGHIMFYKELADQIIDERPVYGIQPIGLDGTNVQFSSILEMANYYVNEIKKVQVAGPYHLLGTCFSNSVTFEIAKILGIETRSIFIVDSPPPYFKEYSKMKKWLRWAVTFNFAKLREAFNDYYKYSRIKEPSGDQEAYLYNTGKHLRKIMKAYNWTPQDIGIILIRSSQNDQDPYKSYHINNWKKLVKRGLDIKIIHGTHQEIFEGKSARVMAKFVDNIIMENDY